MKKNDSLPGWRASRMAGRIAPRILPKCGLPDDWIPVRMRGMGAFCGIAKIKASAGQRGFLIFQRYYFRKRFCGRILPVTVISSRWLFTGSRHISLFKYQFNEQLFPDNSKLHYFNFSSFHFQINVFNFLLAKWFFREILNRFLKKMSLARYFYLNI